MFSAVDPLLTLNRLSDGFARVYQSAAPSVVYIRSELAPSDVNGDQSSGSAKPEISRGSGVIFATPANASSSRHFILTNNHVIDRAIRTSVRLTDGREFDATITGRDPKTDIAVIEIPAAGLTPLLMADSDKVQIGQWVLAIGNPFGLKHSLSVGVVSGTGRTNLGINDYEDYIQTDAAIGPGNSGGPLINLDGEIVGIISSIFADHAGATSAAFAIPINLARTVADQLVVNGAVERAYLGVFLQSLTGPLARAFGAPDTRGALVSEVAPGSPADEAGLRIGDLILAYRGQRVRDAGSFINDLSLTEPNTPVTLTILRDAERRTLTATVRSRRLYEQPPPAKHSASTINFFGMTLSLITPESAAQFKVALAETDTTMGLIVTAVEAGSKAALGGIEPGNILMQVNHRQVSSIDDLNQLMQASRDARALLLLVRQGTNQQFTVLEQY